MKRLRVFIVDDSAVSRKALRRAVEGDGRAVVVGESVDGHCALEQIPSANPDVVLMDIMMSRMDGIEATRALMQTFPKPVLIISDLIGSRGDLNFRALEAGAVDLMRKPTCAELSEGPVLEQFRRKISLLSEIPVITRRRPIPATNHPSFPKQTLKPLSQRVSLVCFGASTGGPQAVNTILSSFDAPPGWPILLVQHMAPGFTEGLVSWLRRSTGLEIEIAADGTKIRSGVVYVAPEARHLTVREGDIHLSSEPQGCRHIPAIDMLFDSVARDSADRTVAILLSGMGADGAAGMKSIREAGGWTIAQNEASSVVYGMPKAAVEIGAAREILSLAEIAGRLKDLRPDSPEEK